MIIDEKNKIWLNSKREEKLQGKEKKESAFVIAKRVILQKRDSLFCFINLIKINYQTNGICYRT